MTREKYTAGAHIEKRLVRRLQKARGIKYTEALRLLENCPEDRRLRYVELVELEPRSQ